jgi:hypothetical protein
VQVGKVVDACYLQLDLPMHVPSRFVQGSSVWSEEADGSTGLGVRRGIGLGFILCGSPFDIYTQAWYSSRVVLMFYVHFALAGLLFFRNLFSPFFLAP